MGDGARLMLHGCTKQGDRRDREYGQRTMVRDKVMVRKKNGVCAWKECDLASQHLG